MWYHRYMNNRLIHKPGETINLLTYLEHIGDGYGIFRCVCGIEKRIRVSHVYTNKIKSCSCGGVGRASIGLVRGISINGVQTAEYRIWKNMKQRCLNKNNISYKRYGAKGVTICDRWLHSFANFLDDMGERPTQIHSIDRIDGSRGYEPSNCKWSTPSEQANNTSQTKYFKYKGKIMTITDISEATGIRRSRLALMINRRGYEYAMKYYFSQDSGK